MMTNHQVFRIQKLVVLTRVFLVIAVVLLASPLAQSVDSSAEQEKSVREFVAAFNSRNIDAMLQLADDNVQWLSISGAKLSIETEGKAALRQSMERYFKSCLSCKSALEWVQIAGTRVTAKERASWTSKSGPKSQSGLSVYEFSGGRILRVYYFPAEADKLAPESK